MRPTIHPLSEEDSTAVAALRSLVAPMKGKFEGIAGRGMFDDIMEQVAVPEGVTLKPRLSEGSMAGGLSRHTLRREPRSFTSMADGSLGERPRRSGTSPDTSHG